MLCLQRPTKAKFHFLLSMVVCGLLAANGCADRRPGLGDDQGPVADAGSLDVDPHADQGGLDQELLLDQTSKVTLGPVAFVVRNLSTNQPLYFGNTVYHQSGGLSFTGKQGADWQPSIFFTPDCVPQCTVSNQGQSCVVGCSAPPAAARQLLPGESYQVIWDARQFALVDGHCSAGVCYDEVVPQNGAYRVESCAHDQVSCGANPCPPPDGTGVIAGATVQGNETCVAVEFSLPHGASQVFLDHH